jgi:hypothetical protein
MLAPEEVDRVVGVVDKTQLEDLSNKGYLSFGTLNLTDKFVKEFNPLNELFKPEKNIDKFVDDYRRIFPAGNNSANYPFRGDKQSCTRKMRKFLKDNPSFSYELILNATREYVNYHFFQGYKFMQTAAYLIEKNGVSNLSALCESFKNRTSNSRPGNKSTGMEEDLN